MSKKCTSCNATEMLVYSEGYDKYLCGSCNAELSDSKNYYKGFVAADIDFGKGADVQMAIESFKRDMPDTPFQWGYLAYFLLEKKENKNV